MRAKQTAQSRSRLALGPGDCSDGYCSVACESTIACAEQDQNRCIVPIRHGEIDMSIPIEISRGCRVRTAAGRDRLARGEFAVAVAKKGEDTSALGLALREDDWKSHVEIAIFVKIGKPHFSLHGARAQVVVLSPGEIAGPVAQIRRKKHPRVVSGSGPADQDVEFTIVIQID